MQFEVIAVLRRRHPAMQQTLSAHVTNQGYGVMSKSSGNGCKPALLTAQ
jgi:hypothetical protein